MLTLYAFQSPAFKANRQHNSPSRRRQLLPYAKRMDLARTSHEAFCCDLLRRLTSNLHEKCGLGRMTLG